MAQELREEKLDYQEVNLPPVPFLAILALLNEHEGPERQVRC